MKERGHKCERKQGWVYRRVCIKGRERRNNVIILSQKIKEVMKKK